MIKSEYHEDEKDQDLWRYAKRIIDEHKEDQRKVNEILKEMGGPAEVAANLRAYESSKPEDERICYDPYAVYFMNPKLWEPLVEHPEMVAETEKGINSVVCRVRYFDDFVKKFINEKMEQLVLLGAGFDTRAYRIEELKNIKVFEVDHPETQCLKTRKIKKIFNFTPENVIYVPIDFEKQKLSNELFNKGYNNSLKTLFIMEGLVYYINPEAVDEMLSFIVHNSGKESAIIFDYFLESVVKGNEEASDADNFFKFAIKDGEIEKFLSQFGFLDIKNVTPEDYKKAYFYGKNENRKLLPSERLLHFAYAVVG